jgi:hypothetical protein
MSEAQMSAAPRRRAPAEADQLAAEFEASGLSRREFCQSRGLNVSTLDAYRRRRRQARSEACGTQRWVAVEVPGTQPTARGGAAASGLAVVLAQGWRIEVGRGFDAGTLAQLLSVLERA